MKTVSFTKHAERMLIERKFRKGVIEDIIAQPEWTETGEGDIWYAFKRLGRKILRVVIKGNNPSTVITMYFDRRLK